MGAVFSDIVPSATWGTSKEVPYVGGRGASWSRVVNNRRKWRVAILGLGHWYSAYGLARTLREYPRAELVAAAWDNKAQLDAFSSTFGVTGYGDYDELLERERIDIVHLAAPVSQLADLTIRSAMAGK